MVPCWEAIVLVLVAEAIGRLALGLLLILAFSLGMLAVLGRLEPPVAEKALRTF